MKKKALVLAVYMACASPSISAAKTSHDFSGLNLGEVKSKSALGEPLKGIIPIFSTSRKDAKRLKVRLAPQSVFTKVGAEKVPELDYLNFRVSTRGKRPVIVVSSDRPMQLPIINFILEIESPKGVIYQDYTIMLDPPSYANISSKAKPHRKKRSSVKKHKSSIKFSKKNALKYTVRKGDTLSKIAKRYKPKGISRSKMMRKIHAANPHAFVHNDINRIKRGVLLLIPSAKKAKTATRIKTHSKAQYKSKKRNSAKNQAKKFNTYKVKKGDSLSKITKKFAYKNVSFTRMMKTIYTSNPHAFSHNRMNQLKAGVRLRIPTYTEVVSKKQQKVSSETLIHKKVSNNPRIDTSKKNLAGDASTATINNLQKRIRELRGELTSVKTDYDELKKTLSIQTPVTPIAKAKPAVKSIVKTSVKTSVNKLKKKKNKHLDQRNAATDFEENIDAPADINADPFAEFADAAPVDDLSDADLAEDDPALDIIIDAQTSKATVQPSKSALNTGNVSFSIFLLLLGLGLLKYRNSNKTDPVKRNRKSLANKPVTFQDLLIMETKQSLQDQKIIKEATNSIDLIGQEPAKKVEPEPEPKKVKSSEAPKNVPKPDNSTVTKNTGIANSSSESLFHYHQPIQAEEVFDKTKIDPSGISPEDLLECERLVDELTQNLATKKAANQCLETSSNVMIDNTAAQVKKMTSDDSQALDIITNDINTKADQELDSSIIDILNDLERTPSLSTEVKEMQNKKSLTEKI